METGKQPEPGEDWGVRGEDWARLHALLELARQAHRTELSQERRDEIRERVLQRLERNERRRRRVRAVVAGASVALLGGLLVMLVRQWRHMS